MGGRKATGETRSLRPLCTARDIFLEIGWLTYHMMIKWFQFTRKIRFLKISFLLLIGHVWVKVCFQTCLFPNVYQFGLSKFGCTRQRIQARTVWRICSELPDKVLKLPAPSYWINLWTLPGGAYASFASTLPCSRHRDHFVTAKSRSGQAPPGIKSGIRMCIYISYINNVRDNGLRRISWYTWREPTISYKARGAKQL